MQPTSSDPEIHAYPDCSKDSAEVERGGFADVSQGAYRGRQVAIKVVRVCLMDNLDVILSVSPRLASSHLHE
jgi:hypothetical protein